MEIEHPAAAASIIEKILTPTEFISVGVLSLFNKNKIEYNEILFFKTIILSAV